MTNLDEKKLDDLAHSAHNEIPWQFLENASFYEVYKNGYRKGYRQAFADQQKKIENLELALKIKNEVCEAINDNGQQAFLLQQRNQKLEKAVELMRSAIDHTNEFCICKRNTYGFDYHEEHPIMGKPKSGSRWLTPRDFIKNNMAKIYAILKGAE